MKHLFTHDAKGGSVTTLWPPLAQVRAELLEHDYAGRQNTPAAPEGSARPEVPIIRHEALAAPKPAADDHLLGPLLDLARRRQAARIRFPAQAWEPGCVVQTQQNTARLGVLLDRQDDSGAFWSGWLTTAEPDWAGWHDVLLEPGDEPSDPSVAVIQAWNRVRIPSSQEPASRVLARLSTERMAAVRAVWDESQKPTPLEIPPAPGRVALRDTADGHMVLTGTPLATNDPRHDHQTLYRDVGQRLIEACRTTSASANSEEAKESNAFQTRQTPPTPLPLPLTPASDTPEAPSDSWWSRILASLRPNALLRPAFALLVLVVIGQQWMLWQGVQDDEVRFRGGTSPAAVPPSLVVRWQEAVRVEEAQALLGSLPVQQHISVLPDGRWLIEVNEPAAARAKLSASPLVNSVEGP